MNTTHDSSPVATLMSDLGIGSEESTPTMEDNSNNSNESIANDSDTSTLNKDDSADKANAEIPEGNTETLEDKINKIQAELEKANKRISDKDRYINELKQGKQEEKEKEVLEVEQEETTFWDDPEGNFKKIAEQLRIANLRIDEQAYASDKPDYWKVVNGESIQEAFKDDTSFMNDFQRSNKPYELAYEYLKSRTETKVQTETRTREQMKEELRKELLKEMGVKNDKEVPPSINNIGSNNSTRKNVIEDGFAAVFGSN